MLLEVLRRIMELIYHTLIRIAELIVIQTSFKNMIFHEEHRFEIKLRQENIASCEIRLLSIKFACFLFTPSSYDTTSSFLRSICDCF